MCGAVLFTCNKLQKRSQLCSETRADHNLLQQWHMLNKTVNQNKYATFCTVVPFCLFVLPFKGCTATFSIPRYKQGYKQNNVSCFNNRLHVKSE